MRTRIFIDGHVLHREASTLGFDIDFKRLREFYFPDAAETVALTWYNIAMVNSDGGSTMRRLIDWLELNGWRCRVIEVEESERNSIRDARPELLVWMAADIITAAARGAERIIVWANDRSLKPALVGAQEAGAVIDMVATAANTPTTIRRIADTFTEIADMREAMSAVKAPA